MNELLAVMGHNKPPSPFEEVETKIDSLYEEALHWLDGEGVDSEESAEGVSTLLNMLRKAGKEADALRKEEKKPHDDAGAVVQAKYKPMLGKIKLATDGCKEVLAPWLDEKDTALRAEAEAKRLSADKAEAEAQAAIQATSPKDLKAREAAEEKVELARKLEIGARSAANAKAQGTSRVGKAIGLKTHYIPEITDPVLAIRHYWPNDGINTVLIKLAERDVRAGTKEIPGFVIREERKAV